MVCKSLVIYSSESLALCYVSNLTKSRMTDAKVPQADNREVTVCGERSESAALLCKLITLSHTI